MAVDPTAAGSRSTKSVYERRCRVRASLTFKSGVLVLANSERSAGCSTAKRRAQPHCERQLHCAATVSPQYQVHTFLRVHCDGESLCCLGSRREQAAAGSTGDRLHCRQSVGRDAAAVPT